MTAKVKAAVRIAAATAEMVAALVEAKVMKAARETATEAVVSETVTGTGTAAETEAEVVAVESTVEVMKYGVARRPGNMIRMALNAPRGRQPPPWRTLLTQLAEPMKDRAGPEEVEVKCEVVLKEQH